MVSHTGKTIRMLGETGGMSLLLFLYNMSKCGPKCHRHLETFRSI